MSDTSGQLYTINSVKVQFPCKAYPSQLSMMDKVRISYAVGTVCMQKLSCLQQPNFCCRQTIQHFV